MQSMSDMDSLLEAIISEARAATDAESCSLALYEEKTDELRFYLARGEKGEAAVERKLKFIRLKMGSGIIGWAASNMQTVNIADVYNDPRFNRQVDAKTGFVTRSILAVPMQRHGKLIGVVEAVNKRNQPGFSEQDEKVLTVLAAQAALVIENARLYEENLQQARFTALGEGLAGSANCIKNILQAIGSASCAVDLGMEEKNLKSVRKGWKVMKRNVQTLRELVLDLLALSSPQRLRRESADVNEMCAEVAGLMRESAQGKDVEILLELQTFIPPAMLDLKSMHRCLLNLVANAIEACDKPRSIVKIGTKMLESKSHVEIAVTDNGCGISDEAGKNLFKTFFSTKGSEGTGLGLAVAQKIVSEHGGDIKVESALGVGTKVTVTLPLR
jgi:signal transduction histidine kinase